MRRGRYSVDADMTWSYLDSDIRALALVSRAFWWSALYALAYATLSRTSSPLSPYLSATASKRTGRKVPSVSMYKHLPSPPPILTGNWHVTASVWHNCDFPVLNSPKSSVIAPVSIPPRNKGGQRVLIKVCIHQPRLPPKSASSCFDPVVICTSSERRACTSVALWNPRGTIFCAEQPCQ